MHANNDPHSPTCIAFTMDGNRRWAKERGLTTLAGHKAGRDTFLKVVEWARKRGTGTLIFYTFSTENWKRSEDEVNYLLELFREGIRSELESLIKDGGRIRFVGDLSRFPADLQDQMKDAEERSAEGERGTIALAVSYGGRAELVAAANALKEKGGEITEADIQSALWTHDLPDPDLIIRTGGQQRMSNFLTWQSVYSELFFTDTLWPDFSETEFDQILDDYQTRQRNFGK